MSSFSFPDPLCTERIFSVPCLRCARYDLNFGQYRRLLKVVFWLRPLNFNLPVYLEIYEASRGNMLYNVTTTAKKSLASGDYKCIHFHLVYPLTTVPVYRSAQRAALFSSKTANNQNHQVRKTWKYYMQVGAFEVRSSRS